jgi:hypothetical protein
MEKEVGNPTKAPKERRMKPTTSTHHGEARLCPTGIMFASDQSLASHLQDLSWWWQQLVDSGIRFDIKSSIFAVKH